MHRRWARGESVRPPALLPLAAMRTADSRTARFALRPRERRRPAACVRLLVSARREGKTTLLLTAHGAKLRNFGVHTCVHQKCLVGDRWCPHVLGAKLRNFGADTCGHQRSPAWHVGVDTCGRHSYVTLPPTRVDPKVRPTRVVLGVYTCGGQSYVTLESTRVVTKVRPKSVGINTCSHQSTQLCPQHGRGKNKWVRRE